MAVMNILKGNITGSLGEIVGDEYKGKRYIRSKGKRKWHSSMDIIKTNNEIMANFVYSLIENGYELSTLEKEWVKSMTKGDAVKREWWRAYTKRYGGKNTGFRKIEYSDFKSEATTERGTSCSATINFVTKEATVSSSAWDANGETVKKWHCLVVNSKGKAVWHKIYEDVWGEQTDTFKAVALSRQEQYTVISYYQTRIGAGVKTVGYNCNDCEQIYE